MLYIINVKIQEHVPLIYEFLFSWFLYMNLQIIQPQIRYKFIGLKYATVQISQA